MSPVDEADRDDGDGYTREEIVEALLRYAEWEDCTLCGGPPCGFAEIIKFADGDTGVYGFCRECEALPREVRLARVAVKLR